MAKKLKARKPRKIIVEEKIIEKKKDSKDTIQVHGRMMFVPLLWVISLFLTFLTIYYFLYAVKFSQNLFASSLILMILGSLAYFTSPLVIAKFASIEKSVKE